MANAIIEELKVYKHQRVVFSDNFMTDGEGYLGKVKIPDKKTKRKEEEEE